MTSDIHNQRYLNLYIGTYTQKMSFVDGKAEGIYASKLDAQTARLLDIHTVAAVENPSFLALSPSGRYLYAVNELALGEGTVSAFAVNQDSDSLTFLNQRSSHGTAPCHLCLVPSGEFVLVANYASGNICLFPVSSDASLGEAVDLIQLSGSGPTSRQSGPHAHMVAPLPDHFSNLLGHSDDLHESHFLVADLGTDRIYSFILDRTASKLRPAASPWVRLSPGSGPRHFVFHPAFPFVYVVGELDSTISLLEWSPSTGLEHLQTISTLPVGYSGQNTAAELQVHPSGKYVYVSNRGHDSLAIFSIDQRTGYLTPLGHQSTLGSDPRHFILLPGGNFLMVANQSSSTLVSFQVNDQTGALSPTGLSHHVPTPVCIQVST